MPVSEAAGRPIGRRAPVIIYLRRDEYMNQTNRIATLKDIAREAGISVTAVSKALNGKGGVSRQTEQRIRDIAERLNYRPNIVAKSLKTHETKTLGVVVADSSEALFAKVIMGIDAVATQEGYSIILCNTNKRIEKEREALNILVRKRVDGLILASSMLTSVEDYKMLSTLGVPVVFLVRRSEDERASYVINDNVNGAYVMCDYLLKTRRDPMYFLNLAEPSPSGRDRLTGYIDAFKAHGVSFDRSKVISCRPDISEGYVVMRQMIDRGVRTGTIFCGCDVIAIGVMEAILEQGIRIPEDIRVAAYDDIDFAAYLRAPLTTIRQPKYVIGYRGTELLINKIRNPSMEPQHIVLQSELLIRKST